ncbi:hypothetical protein N0V90_009805 [Kalmusia sp. IMI 367209]|nr:hypothetical protein N0V90_009805 [Kalmusia sp. IMI 367209]
MKYNAQKTKDNLMEQGRHRRSLAPSPDMPPPPRFKGRISIYAQNTMKLLEEIGLITTTVEEYENDDGVITWRFAGSVRVTISEGGTGPKEHMVGVDMEHKFKPEDQDLVMATLLMYIEALASNRTDLTYHVMKKDMGGG